MTDRLAFDLSLYADSGLRLLVEWSLKAVLLVPAAAGLAWLLRRSAAASRHLVWSLALMGLLAVPMLASVLPGWTAPVAGLRPFGASWARPLPGTRHPVEGAVPGRMAPRLQPAERSDGISFAPSLFAGGLVALWLAGALAGIAYLLASLVGARRLARRAAPVADSGWRSLGEEVARQLHVGCRVVLLTGRGNSMPATFGTLRPVVLLPEGAETWPEERRRLVLLHELAHVKRRDFLTQLLARLVCVMYWFHPAAWYAAWRLRVERELACDQEVLRAGGIDPCDYAEHLVDIARRFRSPGIMAGAPVGLVRPSQLERRLRALLVEGAAPAARGPRLALCLTFALLIVSLAALRPSATPAEAAALPGSGEAPATAGEEIFRWQGRVPAGQQVEVHTIRGRIHAEPAAGDEAEIVVLQRGKRIGREPVKIELRTSGEGIVVCPRSTSEHVCWPSEQEQEHLKQETVDFLVRVPAGARFVGYTFDGDVEAVALRSIVAAGTIDGDIRISTTEHGHGSTVNGNITASFESSGWSGDLEFQSVNGDIDLVLPEDVSAAFEAQAGKGRISSSFPLSRANSSWAESRAEGRLGEASRTLTVKTVEGNISLRRRGDRAMHEVPGSRDE